MGISTFGVTYQDIIGRLSSFTATSEQQLKITDWINEGAAGVAAYIWELGIEPSDVTATEPLYQYARSYIINHAVSILGAWSTRQNPEFAQSAREERDHQAELIKKLSVGVRGDEFDRARNRGTFRKGRAREAGERVDGGRGVGGGWNRNTRM